MVAVRLRIAAAGLAAANLLSPTASSQDEADFYKAYYLEHELGDVSAARALYREVAADRDVPADMRARAERAAGALAEDLAAADFTRLVPRDSILYAELSRPGEELSMLLESLGLLGRIEEGGGLGLSPLLVDGLLGLRGAACAVTSFDPERGPGGVLLLHPGDLDVVRGLIETALPAAGTPEAPIGGFPTWSFEGRAYATLTNRLLVAGTGRAEVEGVLARLRGEGGPSLAENAALADVLERGRGGLLGFCVNAEPVMPMLTQMLATQAAQDPEAAMMLAFLDVKSLRSVSGYVDVDPDGVSLELALELAQGHKNLAFNLLRMPQVERATLERIPAGAAFFVALGLNPAGGALPIARDAEGQAVVSWMDFGREVFGNLRDVTVYGMPSEGGGGPVPDLAVELRVNDVDRSLALWDFALGTASGASGGGGAERIKIAGRPASAYDLGGMPLYVAARPDGLVVSPSRATVERALGSSAPQRSILDDPVFAADAARVEAGHTLVAMANPGRCVAFAGGMMGPDELAEMAPVAELLRDTVVTLGVEHTDTRLAFRARVSALPDVSGLVADAMGRGGAHRRAGGPHGVAAGRAIPAGSPMASGAAHGSAGSSGSDRAGDAGGWLSMGTPDAAGRGAVKNGATALREELDRLARKGDFAAADALGRELLAALGDDANALNSLAWTLSTEEPYAGHLVELCRAASERSNELTDYESWYFVDTLALVMFQLGDVEEAVRLERIAVELAAGDPRGREARDALKRYEAALEEVAQRDV